MQEMLHCYDSTEFLALKSFKSGVRKKKKKKAPPPTEIKIKTGKREKLRQYFV